MTLTEETLRFITAHRHDDVRSLALQAGKHPLADMPAALTQIAGRQTAESKIPTWAATEGILYPPHLSMEQCSSEVTARYKASVVVGHEGLHNTLADLTGGFGIDFSFLAPHFEQATYVERQEVLCEVARHNFPLLGLEHIRIEQADGVDYLRRMQPVDWLFLILPDATATEAKTSPSPTASPMSQHSNLCCWKKLDECWSNSRPCSTWPKPSTR